MSLLTNLRAQKDGQRRAELEKALIHYEAKIGSTLFGPIPAGHRREFFCLDRHTWIWHEEWTDATGKRQTMMTRYTVRPDGVLKSQGSNSYQKLSGNEARHFYQAVNMYAQRVHNEYGRMLQTA
jgi:hypothetical protein